MPSGLGVESQTTGRQMRLTALTLDLDEPGQIWSYF
jgi:hypothetical protein